MNKWEGHYEIYKLRNRKIIFAARSSTKKIDLRGNEAQTPLIKIFIFEKTKRKKQSRTD